jgi:hypothetical protein
MISLKMKISLFTVFFASIFAAGGGENDRRLFAQSPSTAPASTNPSSDNSAGTLDADKYKIGQDDLLEITIIGVYGSGETFTYTVRINSKGEIGLPLLPPLHLAGMSQNDSRRAIDSAYAGAFLIRNSLAAVKVIQAASPATMHTGPANTGDVYLVRTWQKNEVSHVIEETTYHLSVDDNGDLLWAGDNKSIHVRGQSEMEIADQLQGKMTGTDPFVTVLRVFTPATRK